MNSRRLTKSEFIERLDRRSKRRYGGGFTESWYETLRDDGLVFTLERERNFGIIPIYYATCRHYRRALQVRRLHSLGITRRDAQLVQLFVRGYGVAAWEVREAFRQEAVRALIALRSKLRSGHFRKHRNAGTKHAASIDKQTGPIDPRLEAIGLKQPSEFYLKIIRHAFGVGGSDGKYSIAGILNVEDHSDNLPPLVENALSAAPEIYEEVRVGFKQIDRLLFKRIFGAELINSPEFTVCAFVSMLAVRTGGFSMSDIFNMLPTPAGLEKLVWGFFHALIEEFKTRTIR